jgi:hypothetical protein
VLRSCRDVSDAPHADDGRRSSLGDPPITLEEARVCSRVPTSSRLGFASLATSGRDDRVAVSVVCNVAGPFGFQLLPPAGLADTISDGGQSGV